MDQMRCSDPVTGVPACSFARQLHSTLDHAVNWTASLTGDAAAGNVAPAAFSMNPGGTAGIAVTIDASALTGGAARFGELVLTPDDGSPVLHMPIAVAVPPPTIAVGSTNLTFNIPSGATTQSGDLQVGNTGGPTLTVDTNYAPAGSVTYTLLDQPTSYRYGYYSTYDIDYAPYRFYAAQNFQVTGSNVNLLRIVAYGLMTTVGFDYLYNQPVHFRIYRDAAGKPDGSPENDADVGGWDLDTTDDNITLYLTIDAPPTNLAAGNYWLVVYPEMDDMYFGWVWWGSDVNSGSPALSLAAAYAPDWTAHDAEGEPPGMALKIEQQITCGAPWLSVAPPQLNLGALANATASVTVDSTKFGGNSATGFLCLHSNDAKNPIKLVRVNATQN
jgi:hypothetical protein